MLRRCDGAIEKGIINKEELDPAKLQEVYDIGRRDALCRMRDLKLWLEKNDSAHMEKKSE